MPLASRRAAAAALALLAAPVPAGAATPVPTFQVGASAEFKGCYVWLNAQGEPLRNRQGREIGRKAPCGEGPHNHDSYEVLFGEAAGTLVIRDSTHRFECILGLAAGSDTVMVPKLCQPWDE